MRIARVAAAGAAVVGLGLAAAPAQATFAGDNGKIVFGQSSSLAFVDADGTNRTSLFIDGQTWKDVSPSWSPDGKKIAFASNRDGNYDIYVENPDGTGAVNITNDASTDFERPSWSYDGTKLTFEGGAGDLYTASSTGGSVHPLGVTGGHPVWAPGDASIFYSGSGGEMSVPASGGATTLVAPGIGPATVSPDGTEFVFGRQTAPPTRPVHDFGKSRVFARNIATGAERTLTPEYNDAINGASLSPDGKRVIWTGFNGAGTFITGADADGTGNNLFGIPSAGFNNGGSWQPIVKPTPPPVNHAPDCSTVGRGPWEISPANHQFERVVLFGGSDPDGDVTWINITGVTQDEPVFGPGDWTAPDARWTDADNVIRLRAERNERGDGRVYFINYKVTDIHGATCRGQTWVAVRRKARWEAHDSGRRYNSFTGRRVSKRR